MTRFVRVLMQEAGTLIRTLGDLLRAPDHTQETRLALCQEQRHAIESYQDLLRWQRSYDTDVLSPEENAQFEARYENLRAMIEERRTYTTPSVASE